MAGTSELPWSNAESAGPPSTRPGRRILRLALSRKPIRAANTRSGATERSAHVMSKRERASGTCAGPLRGFVGSADRRPPKLEKALRRAQSKVLEWKFNCPIER